MLKIRIIVPKTIAYDGEAVSLTLPLEKGPMMIEAGSTPLILTYDSVGLMKIDEGKTKRFFVLFPFVAVVDHDEVTITSERVESGSSIDSARALAKIEEYKAKLAQGGESASLKAAKAKIEKNLIRLKAKSFSQGGM